MIGQTTLKPFSCPWQDYRERSPRYRKKSMLIISNILTGATNVIFLDNAVAIITLTKYERVVHYSLMCSRTGCRLGSSDILGPMSWSILLC